MSRGPNRERLEPSLLDRLTDEEPGKRSEAANASRVSSKLLRELTIRDLRWLLNTTAAAADVDLSGHPEVADSVLNFGIPDLTGHMLSDLDEAQLEAALREAITRFEPRIRTDSLRVRIRHSGENRTDNAILFEIEGELWSHPTPQQLLIQSRIDLESGDISFVDRVPRGEY